MIWREARSPARRSISATAAAASSCGTTMPARSRGSGSHPAAICQSLTACDSAAAKSRLRSSMPPRDKRDQHAELDAVGVEMLPPHEREVGAGRPPSAGKASTRGPAPSCADARAGRTRPWRRCCRTSPMIAPALRQERVQVGRRFLNAGWMSQSTIGEPLLAAMAWRTGMFIAPPPCRCGILADLAPLAQARIGLERIVDQRSCRTVASGRPSGSTSSPSKCQCG